MSAMTRGGLAVLSLMSAGLLPVDEPDAELGYDDDDDYDFGYEDDDDDLDDFEDDDDDDDDDDASLDGVELGFTQASRKRRAQRKRKRANRLDPRGGRRRRRRARGQSSTKGRKIVQQTAWGKTWLSESKTTTSAGQDELNIRPQHDFRAEDITFEGSSSGCKIISIHFGDHNVFNNANGIPVAVFGASSFLRGVLKGQTLKAGLDIKVVFKTAADGDECVATVTGRKPVNTRRVAV